MAIGLVQEGLNREAADMAAGTLNNTIETLKDTGYSENPTPEELQWLAREPQKLAEFIWDRYGEGWTTKYGPMTLL